MDILGMITGLAMMLQNPKSTEAIYNGAKIIYNIERKTREGTWKDSIHEESHQIVKDAIRKAGQR